MLLMDKLLLFALGITCLTVVLLYVFMKNRFEFYDNKIDLLFNVYQKLAMNIQDDKMKDHKKIDLECNGICYTSPVVVSDDESEDSCSVDTDDSDCKLEESVHDEIYPLDKSIYLEKMIIFNQEDDFDTRSVEEIKISKLDEFEEKMDTKVVELTEEKIEEPLEDTLENHVEIMDKNYSKLTVKELKKLITDKNGPNLKTKQEMIQYLENN
jgi:hypothetical protein